MRRSSCSTRLRLRRLRRCSHEDRIRYHHSPGHHRAVHELKKYVFLVAESANKTEIKKAVSEIFGVKVEKVTTIRMDGKLKRQGRYPAGRTASYKKAVVKLTADSKTIEFFEGMV
mgnify:CR=1 FL=1